MRYATLNVDEIENLHHNLLNSPARMMGEFHFYISRAESKLMSENYTTDQDHAVVNTIIGDIRHYDAIDWWISGNERDLVTLKEKVNEALKFAQDLKKSATELNKGDFVRYKDLLEALKNFSIDNDENLENMLKFVHWLSEPDLRRPAILFAYRPWGSTRMGEREIFLNDISLIDSRTVDFATEIVFGLRRRYIVQYFSVRDELTEAWVDSHTEEEWSTYKGPNPNTVERITCHRVLEQFVEYFKFVRDSLRLVLRETENEIKNGHARADHKFWSKFVETVVEENRHEDKLWDLKTTLSMWDNGTIEKEKSQLSFATDVSAFANTFGGALIIGVTDSPRRILGVIPTENQLNLITNVIKRYTNLPPQLLEVYSIPITEKETTNKRIFVLCIPQSREVIHVVSKKGPKRYVVRGIEGNEPVERKLIESQKNGSVGTDNFDFFYKLKNRINYQR